jgi:hypothetical protein
MSILSQLINERFERYVAENISNIKEKDYDDIFFLTVIKSQKSNFDNQKFHLGLEYNNEDEIFWLFYMTKDLEGDDEKSFITSMTIEQEDVEKYASELTKFVRHLNSDINHWCDFCYKPFNYSSELLKITGSQDKLISNFCKTCADRQITSVHSAIHRGFKIEETACDICHVKCFEPNELQHIQNIQHIQHQSFYFNRLFHVACCKNKILCEKCLKEQHEPKHKNKCFFCKQSFERGCCVFC